MTIKYIDTSSVELVKTNASDVDVALAAWVSNFANAGRDRDSSPERIIGLINFLWRENHTSPFEHGSFTFLVDTPLSVRSEFQRHRTWSYNETSGRYRVMEPRFYIPNPDRPLVQVGKVGNYRHEKGSTEQYALMLSNQTHAIETAWRAYEEQLDAGIAKEVARNVLPLSLMTQFYATANPLNVLKFFMLRSEENALHEIRVVSQIMEVMFKEAMPITYKAFDDNRAIWKKIRAILNNVNIDDLYDKYVVNG